MERRVPHFLESIYTYILLYIACAHARRRGTTIINILASSGRKGRSGCAYNDSARRADFISKIFEPRSVCSLKKRVGGFLPSIPAEDVLLLTFFSFFYSLFSCSTAWPLFSALTFCSSHSSFSCILLGEPVYHPAGLALDKHICTHIFYLRTASRGSLGFNTFMKYVWNIHGTLWKILVTSRNYSLDCSFCFFFVSLFSSCLYTVSLIYIHARKANR